MDGFALVPPDIGGGRHVLSHVPVGSFGLVWFGLGWVGLGWFGSVWFGLVWFGALVASKSTTDYLLFLLSSPSLLPLVTLLLFLSVPFSCPFLQVFDDFMTAKAKKGRLLRYLPTPVYFYGMAPSASISTASTSTSTSTSAAGSGSASVFTMRVPLTLLEEELKVKPKTAVAESKIGGDAVFTEVTVELQVQHRELL